MDFEQWQESNPDLIAALSKMSFHEMMQTITALPVPVPDDISRLAPEELQALKFLSAVKILLVIRDLQPEVYDRFYKVLAETFELLEERDEIARFKRFWMANNLG